MAASASVEQFNGSVLISLNGASLLAGAYGLADFEHNVRNTTITKFRLGSITKPITAMAIHMLAEQGKLKISSPISEYILDAPEHWSEITIQHLLDHRAGLPNFTEFPDYYETQRLPSTPWQTIGRFSDLPLIAKPGQVSLYNNSGYIILGALIELVSGKNYEEFLKENIFQPLRMFNTGYDCAEKVLENRARGYIRSKQGLENAPYLDMSIPFAAGALYSTIEDLFIFDRAIETGKQPIPKEVLKQMQQAPSDNYGGGWHLSQQNGRLQVGHSGGIDGFCTIMLRYPQEKLTIVILSNVVSWAYSPERMSQDLSAIVFGEPYQIPKNRKAIVLTGSEYDIYTGAYKIEEELYLQIERRNSQWFGRFSDKIDEFEIFAESENEFFIDDFETQLKFCQNNGLIHLEIMHAGQLSRANKMGKD